MAGFFSALKQLFSGNPPAPKIESQADKQARYRKEALAFVREKRQEQSRKQRDLDAWYRRYGNQKATELSRLSGTEFEAFLAGLFRQHGYQVELTPTTGDYGADLLLIKDGQRIAVQAKCYSGSVGVAAVQEALSGMAYYHCQQA